MPKGVDINEIILFTTNIAKSPQLDLKTRKEALNDLYSHCIARNNKGEFDSLRRQLLEIITDDSPASLRDPSLKLLALEKLKSAYEFTFRGDSGTLVSYELQLKSLVENTTLDLTVRRQALAMLKDSVHGHSDERSQRLENDRHNYPLYQLLDGGQYAKFVTEHNSSMKKSITQYEHHLSTSESQTMKKELQEVTKNKPAQDQREQKTAQVQEEQSHTLRK